MYMDRTFVNVGSKMNMSQCYTSTALQINCLPDSFGFTITLLSFQFKWVWSVIHA